MFFFLKNIVVFLLPMLILTSITTALLIRSYHLREARIAAVFIGIYVWMFLIEWLRMMLPMTYSFWIHHIFTGTLTVFTLGIIAHSAYLIIENHRTITLRFVPWIFYIPTFCQPLYIWLIYELFGTTYIQVDGWYYVQHPLYSYVLNPFMAIYLVIMYALMRHGKKTAPTVERKQLYQWFMTNIIVMVIASIVLSEFFRTHMLLPDPILLIILYTSLVYAFGMMRHQFSPSLAQRYQSVVEMSPTGIIVVDGAGTVKEINRAAEHMLAINVEDKIYDAFTKEEVETMAKIQQALHITQTIEDVSLRYHHPERNACYELLINAQKLVIDNQVHYTITLRDVTIEREQQRINYELAYFDTLTKLHNRAYFQKHTLEQFQHYPYAAIILSDLNFFKHINDTYGHAVGDEVLCFTAEQFRLVTKDCVDVIRLGGDEFLFFIPDARTMCIETLLQHLEQHFEQHVFNHGELQLHIVPSFGIAQRHDGQETYEELFREADDNMYAHKRAKKAAYLPTERS